MKNEKGILGVCSFAFGSNLILFFVKLYVGLCSNSISIFSDAVNNLFDSLSGLLTLICLAAVMRSSAASLKSTVKKTEQLLSFVMAVIVACAGFYFAYSSLERLMYPTPVWYTEKYLVMLVMTAVAKLLMFAVYRLWGKKISSPVLKVMSVDCVLDFFITSVTVLTLLLSKNESYAFDAVFGVVISTVIVVSSVKMIISEAGKLINFVSKPRRDAAENALKQLGDGIDLESFVYVFEDEQVNLYVKIEQAKLTDSALLEKAKSDCKTDADINVEFMLS